MGRSTSRTPQRKQQLLSALAAGRTVEAAAHAAGISRRTAFTWKGDDPALREEWEAAYDTAVEKIEEKLYDLALDGDVTAIIFILRSRKPAIYNPTMLMKLEVLRLAKETAQREKDRLLSPSDFDDGGPRIYIPTIIETPPESEDDLQDQEYQA